MPSSARSSSAASSSTSSHVPLRHLPFDVTSVPPLPNLARDLVVHSVQRLFCQKSTFAGPAMAEIFVAANFQDVRQGYVRLAVPAMPTSVYNGFGAVHGGAVATIFDIFTSVAIVTAEIVLPEVDVIPASPKAANGAVVEHQTTELQKPTTSNSKKRPGNHVSLSLNCSYPRGLQVGKPAVWEAWVEKVARNVVFSKGRVVQDGVVCSTCDHLKAFVDGNPANMKKEQGATTSKL
ncbi:unnamed protein product [Amoebophrya sp. A120]|nr:unnamed protein product [Amoebophrya sp. A120]|eukprot:GSA120T00010864001.1